MPFSLDLFTLVGLLLVILNLVMIWYYKKRFQLQYFQTKQSQDNFQFALESGRMGTWIINLKNDTVTCSKEMLDLWGIDPETFQGDRFSLQSKVHPADVGKMRAAIQSAIEKKSIYELEYRIQPKPGIERWVISRGRHTFEPNSNIPVLFSGVVYDITEKKEKEDFIASDAKTRDQFFMMASHELRTPLTCLQLHLQVTEWDLKNKYPEAFSMDKLESGLRKQQQNLSRITRIVDHILDESRVAEGRKPIQYEQFDLSEMVTKVIEEFQLIAESADVKIYFQSSEPIQGKWDRFRLEQVLLNLLINAVRYGNKNPIRIEVAKEGEQALMIVRDEGVGIKPEDQERIFRRFERAVADDEVSGIGLGLYISNNIVRAHGGEIRLRSEIGKGSEFAVIIPCHSTVN